MAKKPGTQTPTIRNKKASHKFEILQKLECGLVLRGTEVKSLREGKASLDESHVRIRNDELWLIGCHIAPYEHGNVMNHEPTRPRKLLVHRSELRKLAPKIVQAGLTAVPLRIYFNQRGLAKCTIALARGKAHRDKREDIRKREQKREMDRAMRRGRG
jgi:SsrA-binding protein